LASQINASNSGFGGIVSTGDSSGVLQLQTVGTTAVTIDTSQNTTLAGRLTTASSGIQFSDGSTQTTAAVSPYVLKNRIINGDMVIDQRNAGASVSVSNETVTYITDRWNVYEGTSGSMTSQQSSTAPAGFVNSLLLTVTSAGTATASQLCRIQQRIEGLNVSDLSWGSASAQTITISFWVRSSLTGTYCVNIRNNAVDRSYVATYTISAANTWEQKSVTIAGDTSGTWLTTNGVGMFISWDLGSGSSANTTAGSWVAGNKENTSAQANWIGTASATFYITGVQLERGSTATSFEWLPFGTELALCQRYYEKSFDYGTAPANGPNTTTLATPYGIFSGYSTNASPGGGNVFYKVTKRAIPTVTPYGNSQGYWYASSWGVNAFAALSGDSSMYFSQQQVGGYAQTYGHWASSAEL
jgi:hypothetical protein